MSSSNDNDTDFYYLCQDPADADDCAVTCVGYDDCQNCRCAVVPTAAGGPWGDFMDVFMGLLPILVLVGVTVKPHPWPTTKSLPLAALGMFLIRTMYYGLDPLLSSACIILGLHEALTPLSIMAGAIILFETMEATYCLPYMMREMKSLTQGHPVAESMLIFSFATMVEGASGFGTPVALGAPMLVSTGHDKLKAVLLLLIFNTFATVWGAVGTPIWFGFGSVAGIQDADFETISSKASVAMVVGCAIMLPWVLTILIPWKIVYKNLLFVFLSGIVGTMGPLLGLAMAGIYEFPALLGGLVGCGISAGLIRFQVGLQPLSEEDIELFLAGGASAAFAKSMKQQQSAVMVKNSVMDIGSVSENSVVRDHERSLLAESASAPDVPEADAIARKSQLKPGMESNISDVTEAVVGVDPGATATEDNSGSVEDLPEAAPNANGPANGGGFFGGIIKTFSWDQAKGEDHEPVVVPGDEGPETNDAVVDVDEAPPTENSKDLERKVTFSERADTFGAEGVENDAQTMGTNKSQQETLDEILGPQKNWGEGYLKEMILRTFPIWGVVVLLILTRVEQIGIKDVLTDQSPYFQILFGTYGDFRLSASIVFQLRNILTYPNLNWKYEFIYLPFFLFTFTSGCTFLLFRKNLKSTPRDVVNVAVNRLANPAVALFGALVLVQLLIQEDTAAPAFILGTILADWFKQGFVVISPLLGALGSFFSGSTTVSNLTFADVQDIAAETIGVSTTSMLALQAVGASAGNGVCLNNIISACTVVGLKIGEGQILAQTAKFVFSLTTIATVVMLALYFRF